jgi:hypothetical protein
VRYSLSAWVEMLLKLVDRGAPLKRHGKKPRKLRLEPLVSRRMLNADPLGPESAESEGDGDVDLAGAPTAEASSEPAPRLDVNGDARVTPQDALVVANWLHESSACSAAVGTIDVTADGRVTTEDFDAIASLLNASATTAVVGELGGDAQTERQTSARADLPNVQRPDGSPEQSVEASGEGDLPETEAPGGLTQAGPSGAAVPTSDGYSPARALLDVNGDGRRNGHRMALAPPGC